MSCIVPTAVGNWYVHTLLVDENDPTLIVGFVNEFGQVFRLQEPLQFSMLPADATRIEGVAPAALTSYTPVGPQWNIAWVGSGVQQKWLKSSFSDARQCGPADISEQGTGSLLTWDPRRDRCVIEKPTAFTEKEKAPPRLPSATPVVVAPQAPLVTGKTSPVTQPAETFKVGMVEPPKVEKSEVKPMSSQEVGFPEFTKDDVRAGFTAASYFQLRQGDAILGVVRREPTGFAIAAVWDSHGIIAAPNESEHKLNKDEVKRLDKLLVVVEKHDEKGELAQYISKVKPHKFHTSQSSATLYDKLVQTDVEEALKYLSRNDMEFKQPGLVTPVRLPAKSISPEWHSQAAALVRSVTTEVLQASTYRKQEVSLATEYRKNAEELQEEKKELEGEALQISGNPTAVTFQEMVMMRDMLAAALLADAKASEDLANAYSRAAQLAEQIPKLGGRRMKPRPSRSRRLHTIGGVTQIDLENVVKEIETLKMRKQATKEDVKQLQTKYKELLDLLGNLPKGLPENLPAEFHRLSKMGLSMRSIFNYRQGTDTVRLLLDVPNGKSEAARVVGAWDSHGVLGLIKTNVDVKFPTQSSDWERKVLLDLNKLNTSDSFYLSSIIASDDFKTHQELLNVVLISPKELSERAAAFGPKARSSAAQFVAEYAEALSTAGSELLFTPTPSLAVQEYQTLVQHLRLKEQERAEKSKSPEKSGGDLPHTWMKHWDTRNSSSLRIITDDSRPGRVKIRFRFNQGVWREIRGRGRSDGSLEIGLRDHRSGRKKLLRFSSLKRLYLFLFGSE